MAINVTYGPISTALQLAQRSGQGEDFWRRFAAGQQVQQNLNQQTSQALQRRQMDISESMAQQRMAQEQQQFAQTQALRQAQTQAESQRYEAQQARAAEQTAYQRQQQELENQLRQQASDRAERGQGLQEQAAQLAIQREKRLQDQADQLAKIRAEQAERYKGTSEYKAFERQTRELERQNEAGMNFLKSVVPQFLQDNLSVEEWEPPSEANDVVKQKFAEVKKRVMDNQLRLAEMDYQMGQRAAQNVLGATSQPAPAAVTQAELQDAATKMANMMLASGAITKTLPAEKIKTAVARQVESVMPNEDQAIKSTLVDMITSAIKGTAR